ncbi:hypothetical protein MY11210_001946 [Beauveria gryllotalpidicola]
MAAPKIIVLGSLHGNLEPAFKKLSALHAKNSFTLALLTGDVFGPSTPDSVLDALLSGSYPLPLPTYFSVGAAHPLPARIVAKLRADEDVCPNLHFLGRRSVTKTSDGLRIVSLGGALVDSLPPNDTDDSGPAGSKEQHVPFHTQDDARSLKGANGADILLTSTWPADIWKYSKVALDDAHKSQMATATASRCVAELCAALRPRYHLAASPDAFFYEREPFIQAAGDANSEDGVSVTRFISLAPYGNAAKQKALYAFTLNKTVDDAVPPGATASPLLSALRDKKRLRNDADDDDDASSYNRYGQYHDGRRQKRHRHHQQLPPPGPDQCFFCLSNPNTATHMVCSVGDDAYVTTAKGPLPLTTTYSSTSPPSSSSSSHHALTFPGHLLIIPLPHTPTLSSSSLASARLEMTRFRLSLQSMLARRFSLGAITWEISRARNVHLVWQLVALPAALVTRGLAEAALRVEADAHDYPAFVTKEDEAGDFVRVWLWAESDDDDAVHSKTLVMPLEAEARFDLQFVRRAVGKLLGLEARRVRWQDCTQTEDEETKDAEAFREAFKEWDFTLE